MSAGRANSSSPRIAVLYGGASHEREISLHSGIQVAAALEEAGCAVRAIDPAEIDLRDIDWRAFDAAYIALNGGAGDDGHVQTLLAALGVPFTGSGAAACAIAHSKRATKKRLSSHGIPTAPWRILTIEETFHTWVRQTEPFGFPLVVKPDEQGSSLGVGVANDVDELQTCLAESFLYGPQAVVEPYLAGSEFTVGVIGRRPLPLLEVVCRDPIYSFAGKYDRDGVEYLTEAHCCTSQAVVIKRMAVEACAAIDTTGLARVDLRCDRAGRPFVLEVNTSPSMAVESLIPRAARLADVSLAQLCRGLVEDVLVIAAGGKRR